VKKTFAETALIVLVILNLAYIPISPTNSVAADTEAPPTDAEWILSVTGLVENPLNLTWTEITAMPTTTVNAAIICVDFPNNIVTEGNWKGVKLQTLLEAAKPLEDAIKVAFYADGGYSTDLTVDTAMRDDVIIAYEKDGGTLDNLRLVVPGKWGYKWIHHLTRIELVDYDFLGYWEGAGYPDEADVTESSPSNNQFTPSIPDFFTPTPLPTTPIVPSPSPEPYPTPSTPPAPLTQSTPTPEPSENTPIPPEAVYAITASVIVVILVGALTVARKTRK
jgi:hypothetical protein